MRTTRANPIRYAHGLSRAAERESPFEILARDQGMTLAELSHLRIGDLVLRLVDSVDSIDTHLAQQILDRVSQALTSKYNFQRISDADQLERLLRGLIVLQASHLVEPVQEILAKVQSTYRLRFVEGYYYLPH